MRNGHTATKNLETYKDITPTAKRAQRASGGEIQLIHGDSLDVMEEMQPENIDLIVSDPPYAVFNTKRDSINFDAPIDWQRFEDLAGEILKPDGQVILFCDFKLLLKLRSEFSRLRYDFHHCVIKSSAMPKGAPYPLPDVEYLAIFRKGKISDATFNPKAALRSGEAYRKKNYQREVSTRRFVKAETTTGDGSRWVTTSLFMQSKPNLPQSERTEHPFQKEINLLREIIRVYSNPGDVILDTFCGSGSTLVACHLEHRKGIGIEKDRQWHNVAAERIAQATAQIGIFN